MSTRSRSKRRRSRWRALTDADQLTGWYVERAEVDRAGGQYFISWERGWTVGARSTSGSHLIVSAWSISRQVVATRAQMILHLRSRSSRSTPSRRQGGTTVLRMVNSGIPDSADWDSFYDGTDVGWDGFFLALRHYILHHAGEPRSAFWIMAPFTDQAEVGWERLTAALAKSGKLSGLTAGDRYDITTSLGDHLYGRWWR